MKAAPRRGRAVVVAAAGMVLLALAGLPASSGQGPAAGAPAAAAGDDPLASLARARKTVVIADFGLGLCRQCKLQAAILERIKGAYGDKVVVRMVAVNTEHALVARYGVETIPHLVFLDPSGEVRFRKTGVMSFEDVSAQLRRMGVAP